MVKKSLFIFAFLILLTINICSAEVQSIGPFQSGSCINLPQSCSNCTFVNITKIQMPNSTTINPSELMSTRNGINFNYTYCPPENVLGKYIITTLANPDGESVSVDYDFIMNGSGQEVTIAQAIVYIFSLIIGFLILGFTIVGVTKIPFRNTRAEDDSVISINNLKYVKVVLLVFVYLEVLFLVAMARNISIGFLMLTDVGQFFNILYFIMLSGTLVLFPLIFFFTITVWLADKQVQKDLERGIPVR